VLADEVRVEGNEIIWAPQEPTRDWLTNELFPKIKGRGARVLMRLTLKGDFVYTKSSPRLFLDGDPFGPRSSVNFQPRSGDGTPGGDFELWFWLREG
jgi:hypothetical protein